jgi:hypothetical protein
LFKSASKTGFLADIVSICKNIKEITNFAWAKFVILRGEAFKVKTQRTGFAGFLFVQIRFKNGVFGGLEQTKNPSLRRWVLTLAERGDCEPTPLLLAIPCILNFKNG